MVRSQETAEAGAALRTEPVQARSTARLNDLLDAAAQVVDEVGYERLTTAMVAERAGASIGTVYRYFPDRIAVLQALAARHLDRVASRISEAVVDDDGHTSWWDAYDSVFDVLVAAYRDEPGFRSLRFGDTLDLGPDAEIANNERVAAVLTSSLAARFGTGDTDQERFAVTVATEIADALVTRAFAADAHGDERLLTTAKGIVRSHLTATYGDPA